MCDHESRAEDESGPRCCLKLHGGCASRSPSAAPARHLCLPRSADSKSSVRSWADGTTAARGLRVACFVLGQTFFCAHHLPTSMSLLLHFWLQQDLLGRWSVLPVIAVGLCVWTKWNTWRCEGKQERGQLEEVRRARAPRLPQCAGWSTHTQPVPSIYPRTDTSIILLHTALPTIVYTIVNNSCNYYCIYVIGDSPRPLSSYFFGNIVLQQIKSPAFHFRTSPHSCLSFVSLCRHGLDIESGLGLGDGGGKSSSSPSEMSSHGRTIVVYLNSL